jgi:hypothetical protein
MQFNLSTSHNLFSVSVDLAVLDISYKWEYVIHGHLHLTSLT